MRENEECEGNQGVQEREVEVGVKKEPIPAARRPSKTDGRRGLIDGRNKSLVLRRDSATTA